MSPIRFLPLAVLVGIIAAMAYWTYLTIIEHHDRRADRRDNWLG